MSAATAVGCGASECAATLEVRGARQSGVALQESVMTIQERLERAFDLRGTPVNTRSTYRWCIGAFERFAGRPAGELGREDVERFLLHLVRDRKVRPSTHNVYAGALKFLYRVVLERPEVMARVPRRKQPMRLPVLPSSTDIVRLFAAVESIAVRTIVMLAYGAGLRVSERASCGSRTSTAVGWSFTFATPSGDASGT